MYRNILPPPGVVDGYDGVDVVTATDPPLAAATEGDDEDEILKEDWNKSEKPNCLKSSPQSAHQAFFKALLNDCYKPVETATCNQKFPKPGTVERSLKFLRHGRWVEGDRSLEREDL